MRIGSYDVEAPLGRGAFSIVYRARADDGRHVALKVLDATEHDEETLERFLREARIAARLVDESFPRIHEIGSDGSRHFIAMDLVEGTALDTLLREHGPLPLERVIEVAVQLARALSVAHATGIVHRDIKPANLILHEGGRLQLLDFGLSHMVGMQSISAPGVLVGTVPYMSPEQLLGEGVDARSDVFSASAVLYELLTGTRPFPGDRFETVSHAILNVSPSRLAVHGLHLAEPIERVLFKGLMKRPEDRYESADALLHDWELIARDPMGASSGSLLAQPSVLRPESRESYAPLVGREEPIARIESRLATIAPDGGCLVALSGEAGVGKTRLLETIGECAVSAGLEVLDARCQGGRGTRAYQAWADLLERYVERRGARTPDAVHALFDEMGLGLRAPMLDLLLRSVDPGRADEATGTRGLWETFLAFWRSAASRRAVVIVLDDLHRADVPTLQFLGYLTANLRGVPLVVCTAFRSDDIRTDAGAELADVMVEARAADRLMEIPLDRLSRAEVETLIAARFGVFEEQAALAARVFAESDGNALYVIETLKLLEAEGRLDRGSDGWRIVGDLEELPIPEKVADVIRQRLAGVAEPDRELLDAAAVAGDTFPAKVLAECFETSQLDVLRRLRRLEKVNGVVISTEGGFRFAQSKIREYLLDGVPPALRTAYHASIAHTFIAEDGDDDSLAAEIAEHLIEGGEATAAAPYLERSGDRSFRLFANDSALDAYERARDIVESHEGDTALTARCRLGRKTTAVELRLGRLEEAILTASVALRLARRIGHPIEIGEVLLLLAEAQANRGDDDRALATLGEAREVFETAGSEDGVARTLDHRGNVLQREGRLDEALGLYREAFAVRERLGSRVATARSHYRIGSVLKRLGRLEESLAELIRAREVLDGAGEAVTAASTSGEIGSVHFMRGEYDDAAHEYERCLDVMRAAGERRRLGIALMNAGSAELFRGNLGRAQALYRECLALRLELGDEFGIGLVQTNLAAVFRYQARYREAILAAYDGVELTRELKDLTYFAEATTQTGWVAYDLDDHAAARGWFERAIAVHREKEASERVAARQINLAEVAIAAGDAARARRLLGEAEASAGAAWGSLAAEELLVRADLAAGAGHMAEAADLAARACATTRARDHCTRVHAETRRLAHAVHAGGAMAREAVACFPGALAAAQQAGLRGRELALRLSLAELLGTEDPESAIGEMKLALAVADPIIRDVPGDRRPGWARRSGYRAALEHLARWADATGAAATAQDARERLSRLRGEASRSDAYPGEHETTTRSDA